jgi:hypothetical protein
MHLLRLPQPPPRPLRQSLLAPANIVLPPAPSPTAHSIAQRQSSSSFVVVLVLDSGARSRLRHRRPDSPSPHRPIAVSPCRRVALSPRRPLALSPFRLRGQLKRHLRLPFLWILFHRRICKINLKSAPKPVTRRARLHLNLKPLFFDPFPK